MIRAIYVLYAFLVLPSTCHDNTASIVVATTTDRTIFNDLETIRPEGTTPTAEKAIEMKDFVQAALDNFTTAADYPEDVLSTRDVTGIGLGGNAAVAEERIVTTERIVESILSDDELNDYIYGDSLFDDEEKEEIGTSTVKNDFTKTIVDYIYGKESSSTIPSSIEDLPSLTTARILHINSPISTSSSYTQDNNLDSTTTPTLDVKGGNPIVITSLPFPFEVEESIITVPSILMDQINSKKDFNLIGLDEGKHEDSLIRKEKIDDLPNKEISFTSTGTAEDLDSSISSIDDEKFETTTVKISVTSEKLISTNTISIPKDQDLLKIATNAERLEIFTTTEESLFTNPIFTTEDQESSTFFTEAEKLDDISKTSTILVTTENPISTKTIPTQASTKIVTDPEQFEITTSESFAPFSTTPTLENSSTLYSSTINEGEEQKEEKVEKLEDISKIIPTQTTEDSTKIVTDPEQFEITTGEIFAQFSTTPTLENPSTLHPSTINAEEELKEEKEVEESTTTTLDNISEITFNSETENYDYTTTEDDYDETNLSNPQETTTTIIDIWLAERNATRKKFEKDPTNNEATTQDFETISSGIDQETSTFSSNSALPESDFDDAITTESVSFRNQKQLKNVQISHVGFESKIETTTTLDEEEEEEERTKEEEKIASTAASEENITGTIFSKELIDNGQFTADAINILKMDNYETTETSASLNGDDIEHSNGESTSSSSSLSAVYDDEKNLKKEENDDELPSLGNTNFEVNEETGAEIETTTTEQSDNLQIEENPAEGMESLEEQIISNDKNEETETEETIKNEDDIGRETLISSAKTFEEHTTTIRSKEENLDQNFLPIVNENIEEEEESKENQLKIKSDEELLANGKEEISEDEDIEELGENVTLNSINEESVTEIITNEESNEGNGNNDIPNEEIEELEGNILENEEELESIKEEIETTTKFDDNREELIKTEENNEDDSEMTRERIETTTEKNEELEIDFAEDIEETIKNEDRNEDESKLTGEEIETTTKFDDGREETTKNEEMNEETSDELDKNEDESELTREEIESTTKFDDSKEETIKNEEESNEEHDDDSESIREENEVTTKLDGSREKTTKNEEKNLEITDELDENEDESELTEEEIETTTKFDDSKEETIKNEEESDEEHDDDSESVREENEATTKFDDSREKTIDNEERSKENDDVSETTGEEIETTTKFDDNRDETNEEIDEELEEDLSGNEEATIKDKENDDLSEMTGEEIESTTKSDDSKEETINSEETSKEDDNVSESTGEEIETTTKSDDNRDETINNEESSEEISDELEENEDKSKSTGEDIEATTKPDDGSEERIKNDDDSESTREDFEVTTRFDENSDETIKNEELEEDLVENRNDSELSIGTNKNEEISETNQENDNRTILKSENEDQNGIKASEENPKTLEDGNREEGQFQQDDIKTTDSIITSMKELDELDNNILNRTSTMAKTLDDPTTSTNSLEETEENEEDLDLITKINIPLSSLPEEQELFSKHVFKTYIDKITTEEALIEYIQTLSTPKNLVDMLRGEDSNGVQHLLTDRDTKQLNLTSLDVQDWQKISLNGLAEEDGDLDGGRGNDSSDSLIDVLPTHYYDEDYHSEEFNSSETSYSPYILTIPKNEDDDCCLYGNISLRILIGEHVIDLPQNSYVSFNSSAQRYDLAVSWKTEGVVKANNSVVIRLAFDERIYFVEFVEIIHVDEVEVTISSKDDLALLTTKIGDKMTGSTTIDFENGYQLELIDVNLRLRNISSNYEDPTSASRENAVISKTMLIAICASASSCLLLLIAAALLYRKLSSKATVYKMTIE